ncbi:hypothetical protein EWB00_009746, partial [Schistosoma japonicum]
MVMQLTNDATETKISKCYSNSSQRTHISRQEAVEPIDKRSRDSENQKVPLHDSVRLPWERCVHPSGSQVPYYK